MGGLFTAVEKSPGSRNVKTRQVDRDAFKLKLQRDKFSKYMKRLEISIEAERKIAKDFLASGNKKLALNAVRRKKFKENCLNQVIEQHHTLELLISQVEYSDFQLRIVDALKNGTTLLSEINKKLSIKDVEEIKSDALEAIEQQQEIDEKLREIFPISEDVLTEELQSLIEHQKEKQKLDLPSVPIGTGIEESQRLEENENSNKEPELQTA